MLNKNLKLLFVLLLLCTGTTFVIAQANNKVPENLNYRINLIKFYLAEEAYDNVIAYSDSSISDSTMLDSLYYYKAEALNAKQKWYKAALSYANSLFHSPGFNNKIEEKFYDSLTELSAIDAIEICMLLINRIQDQTKLSNFLKVLAKIYEDHHLFGEAIDVYKTLISDFDLNDKIFFEMKIAKNYIYLKEYDDALNTLGIVIAVNDSAYVKDALYYQYIASYSKEDYKTAKKSLIRLYCDFPEHDHKKEILTGLIELFENEDQLLTCWFLKQELFKISSETEKIKIFQEISKLKRKILSISPEIDQFKNFKLNFKKCNKNLPENKLNN